MKFITKVGLAVLGTISMVLGIIGVFLPLLPTTPLLLLSAACYIRSSEKMYNFLVENKVFGSYIKNYRESRGIPKRIKLMAITFLWVGIGYSALFVAKVLWLSVLLITIAAAVTIHIVRIKTLK